MFPAETVSAPTCHWAQEAVGLCQPRHHPTAPSLPPQPARAWNAVETLQASVGASASSVSSRCGRMEQGCPALGLGALMGERVARLPFHEATFPSLQTPLCGGVVRGHVGTAGPSRGPAPGRPAPGWRQTGGCASVHGVCASRGVSRRLPQAGKAAEALHPWMGGRGVTTRDKEQTQTGAPRSLGHVLYSPWFICGAGK